MTFALTINGKQVETAETFEVINPASGAAAADCALGTIAELDAAVAAARAA